MGPLLGFSSLTRANIWVAQMGQEYYLGRLAQGSLGIIRFLVSSSYKNQLITQFKPTQSPFIQPSTGCRERGIAIYSISKQPLLQILMYMMWPPQRFGLQFCKHTWRKTSSRINYLYIFIICLHNLLTFSLFIHLGYNHDVL